MKAKLSQKEQARKLRKAGQSVRSIAKDIECSVSSVSVWVRDIKLSEKRHAQLMSRTNSSRQQASLAITKKFEILRESYKEAGRQKAKEGDIQHAMACALYWAEGAKKTNAMVFCNTDTAMIKIFYEFLKKNFSKAPKIQFCFHEDEGNAGYEETHQFWCNLLNAPKEMVTGFKNKDNRPRTGQRKNRHRYGMVLLTIHSTEVVHHIYGALEVYSGVKIKIKKYTRA